MTANTVARTEFAAAIAQICSDRKITPEAVYSAIKQALISAYRKQMQNEIDETSHFFAQVNEQTGESKIFKAPIVEQDPETLEVLSWDESKAEDVTPAGFGRIAAQTAKQVILQKIRESEKEQVIADYSEKMGQVMMAQVLRMDGRTVVLDLGRGQAFMPPEEQMRGEFYRMNSRIAIFLKEISDSVRGQRIVVSRAAKELVAGLFEKEVPEVASGAVKIVNLAREAGVRTKLSVKSTQDGVDPVGSCVGQRGVRVQEVIKELNNEKIDIIPHSEDMNMYVKGALAPAENLTVEVDEKNKVITVTVPADQLSLAIGRGGQNVRLAAKLLGYKVTIKSDGEVKSQATGDEEYEIDTFKGLNEDTRAYLIQNKLTTTPDLMRFKDKWSQAEEITADQAAILAAKVAAAEEADRKIQAERRAVDEQAARKIAADSAAAAESVMAKAEPTTEAEPTKE